MKREELLKRLGYVLDDKVKVRVIVDSDAANEADDHFAIVHHLLTPSFNILGLIATHFETKKPTSHTMEESYKEIKDVLHFMDIDDVEVLHGSVHPILNGVEESEGALKIIEEAKKGPLYVACQGAMTNVANAIKLDESIAKKLTVIWNGGHPYSAPRPEFNVMQDVRACQIVLESEANIWQIPQDVYSKLEVSLAELKARVSPCGNIGHYLFKQLFDKYMSEYNPNFKLRTGENWTLGDNTTIGVLLLNHFRDLFEIKDCPILNDKGIYIGSNPNKKIKVFKDIDVRFVLEDLFNILLLVYGK